jgi:methionyl-tRNA formyltransferase
MRVVVASSSPLALPTIEMLQRKASIELLGLLTTPDRPKGRSGKSTPNELAELIAPVGMKIWKPSSHEEIDEWIRHVQPDLVVVISYGRLITKQAIESVPHGWINLHFSLLPAYRGAAPVQRAILAGEPDFGLTVFQIDTGMDTGPIYRQEITQVEQNLPATQILETLSLAGAALIEATLQDVQNDVQPKAQEGSPSLAPKIQKAELHLDLSKSGDLVLRQFLAFTKRPGVWFSFNGKRHVVTSVAPSNDRVPVGRIGVRNNRVFLGTRDNAIEILTLIPEGRKEMTGIEWARGLRIGEDELSHEEIVD